MQLRAVLRLHKLFGWDEGVPAQRSTGTAWLNGLRGAAALQVLLFHFFARYPEQGRSFGGGLAYFYQWPLIRSFWAGGSGAVALFFVISGYVITIKSLTLLRQRRHDQLYRELCSSLIRRGLRLYLPVLILSIPSIFLVQYFDLSMAMYVYKPERKENLAAQIAAWFKSTDHLLNPYLYPDHDPEFDAYPYVPTSWTIPLEYRGSILCYIVVMALSRVEVYRRRACFTAGLAAYALHRGSWWNSNFFVGLAMADYCLEHNSKSHHDRRRLLCDAFFLFMFVLGLWFSGAPPPILPYEELRKERPGFEILYRFFPSKFLVQLLDEMRWYYYWSGNFVFIAVSQLPKLQETFETSFCQWLGKLSFSMYLLHGIVFAVLTDPIRRLATPITGSDLIVGLFEFGIMVPVTFMLSAVFEKYVDRGSINLARQFEQLLTKSSSSENSKLPFADKPIS